MSVNFPRKLLHQMLQLESVRILDIENLIFTTSDLDFLCLVVNNHGFINLRNLHFKLHEIPTSCVAIREFFVYNQD